MAEEFIRPIEENWDQEHLRKVKLCFIRDYISQFKSVYMAAIVLKPSHPGVLVGLNLRHPDFIAEYKKMRPFIEEFRVCLRWRYKPRRWMIRDAVQEWL